MDEKLWSALIAASVSGAASLLTLLNARWQVKSKLTELEQAQLKEVLAARMKAYPKLWRILQEQISNLRLAGRRADGAWAKKLYDDLNSCHAAYGVLFSQPVYKSFCEVRAAVGKLADTHHNEQEVSAAAVKELDQIWSGRDKPGLATQLKDDLGSYRSPLISARK